MPGKPHRSISRRQSWVAAYGLAALLGVAILVLPLSGCKPSDAENHSNGSTDGESAIINVTPAEVDRRPMAETSEVPATVEGFLQADLMARVEGFVGQVLVDIGDPVTEGQVLAVLDVPEILAEEQRRQQMLLSAQAEVDSRKAELVQARSRLVEEQALGGLRETEFDRYTHLVTGEQALSQHRLDEARYALQAARAAIERSQADIETAQAYVTSAEAMVGVARSELAAAQAMAGYLTIRAPFDGVITERLVDPGALVQPDGDDDPLFRMENIERLRVVVYLPFEEAGRIDRGDPAVLHDVPGKRQARFDGEVTRSATSFQRGSRMMRAEIDLSNPVDTATGRRPLMPGDYGMVTLTLEQFDEANHYVVPEEAIGEDARGPFVVVIGSGDKCERRAVEVSALIEGNAVIQGNLQGITRVVAESPDEIDEGQVVTYEQ